MRPAGVHERIQQLRKRDEEHASAQPQQALRRTLTWLIHGCALLAYGDTGTSPVVETYRSALGLLDDPAQQRTGSMLEHASLDCLSQLQDDANLAQAAAGSQRHATRDEELARPALVQIPPKALVGHTTRDAPFRMACFNAAGACLDDVISPHKATALITSVGYYEPADERDLLTAMRTLRVRYEDESDVRATIAEEILDQLRAWNQKTFG